MTTVADTVVAVPRGPGVQRVYGLPVDGLIDPADTDGSRRLGVGIAAAGSVAVWTRMVG